MATSMLKNKLTLWLDRDVIAAGKAEAKRQHKSLSEMFVAFIRELQKSSKNSPELSSRLKRLKGSLKGKTMGKEDYHNHIERKYIGRG